MWFLQTMMKLILLPEMVFFYAENVRINELSQAVDSDEILSFLCWC